MGKVEIGKMDKDTAKDVIYSAITNMSNKNLKYMCETVLNTGMLDDGYGSSNKHHCFLGGLLIHTAEVVQNAVNMVDAVSKTYPVNYDIVITAAIFHDIGKREDYKLNSVTNKIEYTRHKKLIGHIIKSSNVFYTMYMNTNNYNEKLADEINHCILAHHGKKEWGSPVEPETIEAFIINWGDMVSAWFMAKADKENQ